MSEISDISSILQTSVLQSLLQSTSGSKTLLERLQEQASTQSSTINTDTLTRLINGEYNISLRDFTSLNTYNTVMSNLYGSNSANLFQTLLSTLSNSDDNNTASAKSFIDTMKEKGLTNEGALRLYTGLRRYSVMTSMLNNYSYVNATV